MIPTSIRVLLCTAFTLTACASNSGETRSSQTTTTTSSSPGPESSASPAATSSPAPADADGGAIADLPPMPTGLSGPPQAWASMSPDQKGHYMHDTVLPAMRSLFSAYDSATYANVTCATCHGANARDVHFHMPNTLPTIFAFNSPQQQALFAHNRRLVAFMHERLVPSMAQLLGEQPFSMQTHTGFGCLNCHPHE